MDNIHTKSIYQVLLLNKGIIAPFLVGVKITIEYPTYDNILV